jgi:nucleoside-diphosphate-sugar epimerase
MKLLVLGATGETGKAIVRVALTAGHEVTILVRNPEKAQSPHAAWSKQSCDRIRARGHKIRRCGGKIRQNTAGPHLRQLENVPASCPERRGRNGLCA